MRVFKLTRTYVYLVVLCRRIRPVECQPHRVVAGEVSVRAGGVLQDAVPESAHQIWQIIIKVALAADGQFAGHRAIIFCKTSR